MPIFILVQLPIPVTFILSQIAQGFWVLSREGAFGEQLEALTWAGGDALEDGFGRSPAAPQHRPQ
jgi:hypothetical protein